MIDGSLIPLYFHEGPDAAWNPDIWCVELSMSRQAAIDSNVHMTHEQEAIFTLTGSFENNVARLIQIECIER